MGIRGPVQDHEGPASLLRGPDRSAQLRRPGREQVHGLVHISPGRRDTDPEPGRELGERLAFPQVDQDEQGLLPGVQLPPARPDRLAVAADEACGVPEVCMTCELQ